MPKSMARTAKPVATARPTRTTTPARPSHTAGITGLQPPNGTVRGCVPQRGELLRHRVMSADGRDVAVTTAAIIQGYVSGVYPVQSGYLVLVCQPLYEVRSASAEAARTHHEELVRTLAEVGVRVVRSRHQREMRIQAEHSAPAASPAAPVVAALGATA